MLGHVEDKVDDDLVQLNYKSQVIKLHALVISRPKLADADASIKAMRDKVKVHYQEKDDAQKIRASELAATLERQAFFKKKELSESSGD